MTINNKSLNFENDEVNKLMANFPNHFITTLDDKFNKEAAPKREKPRIHLINNGPSSKFKLNELKDLNSKEAGIFFTSNQFIKGRKKEDCIGVNAWIMEIDNLSKIEQLKLIENCPLPPSIIIETKKSFHCYWLAKNGTIENHGIIVRGLIAYFNSDPACKDINRILRIPGFYHNKQEPYLVTIKKANYDLKYTEEQMFKAFPYKEKKKKVISGAKTNKNDFWDFAAGLDNKMMLERMSGTTIVNDEVFSFIARSGGGEHINVNNEPADAWLDEQGNIGSGKHGGPKYIQWLEYYGHTKGDIAKWLKETCKDLFPPNLLKSKQKGVSVHPSSQTPLVPLLKDPITLEQVHEKTRMLGLTKDYFVDVIIAVYISTFLQEKKNPAWLMIVGAPSSNKTSLVSLIRYVPDIYRLDTMTANPFSSGQKENEKPKDLLPLLQDKCFIVKDYSTLFGRNEEVVKQLVTDLVAIYDGEYAKHSPTRGTIRYNTLFSHIGCITALALNKRQQYMNMIGPRFLQLNVPRLNDEERALSLNSIWEREELAEVEKEACLVTSSFCVQLKERLPNIKLKKESAEIIEKINALANLTAHARGVVTTEATSFDDGKGKIKTYYEVVDTQIEEPFRALFQLRKMCRSLAIVRGKEEVTMAEFNTVRKIALSSMPIRRAEVLSVFQKHPMQTAKEVSEQLKKTWKTCKRNLDELCGLGVLDSKKEPNDLAAEYFPVDQFRDILCFDEEANDNNREAKTEEDDDNRNDEIQDNKIELPI